MTALHTGLCDAIGHVCAEPVEASEHVYGMKQIMEHKKALDRGLTYYSLICISEI